MKIHLSLAALMFLGPYLVSSEDHKMLALLRNGSERKLLPCSAWQYQSGSDCLKCSDGQVQGPTPTTCKWCQEGTVRGSADGKAESACVDASPICTGAWQYAQYGKCQKCPDGQVGNSEQTGCQWCDSGTVRGSADGKEESICVDASPICTGAWQYAQYGKCQKCPDGQVGNSEQTGCSWCPNGSVRGNENGSEENGCINASVTCPGAWQYAQYGKCQLCPNGQNANTGKTGCEWCPDGSVKGVSSGISNSPCTGICKKSEHAQYGKCNRCPDGQVGGPGSIGCKWCPNGFVRATITDSSDLGCILAAGSCPGAWQYAQYGKCQKCPDGQVGNTEKTGCQWCLPGTVRGISDGTKESDCVDASTVCTGAWQYAQYGKCQTCPDGQVGNTDNSGCQWCVSGTVRGTADGKKLSDCVDASTVCTSAWQYAQYGKCQTCPDGQVGNPDNSGCQWCDSGTVRGSSDGKTLSDCIDASLKCSDTQYAQYGKCNNCPAGKVHTYDWKQCMVPPTPP